MRREYAAAGLDEAEALADPIAQFERWFADARRAEVHEPNAMTLATVDADGRPAARMVLLKGFDGRGLAFYTNRESRKAGELSANPKAALVFWWGPLQRQVRFEGTIEEVDPAEADAYFASRPRGSQLAAWASAQSSLIAGRAALEAAESGTRALRRRTRSRGRRSGAATAWCRPWWSSGTAARAACTTGCAIPGRRTAGGSSGWRRKQACSAAAAAPSR